MKEAFDTPTKLGSVFQHKDTGKRVEVIGFRDSRGAGVAVVEFGTGLADVVDDKENYWFIPAQELHKEVKEEAKNVYPKGSVWTDKRFNQLVTVKKIQFAHFYSWNWKSIALLVTNENGDEYVVEGKDLV